MKIRTGFVSNSSSSSFIVIAKKEDYEKIYSECTPTERKLLDHINPKYFDCFGLELVKFCVLSGNEDSFDSFEIDDSGLTADEIQEFEEYGASYVFDTKVLRKFNDFEHIEHSENF